MGQRADLPARGDNGSPERCRTPDAATLTCIHAGAFPDPGAPLLYYQVVGVCADDPAFEGPN